MISEGNVIEYDIVCSDGSPHDTRHTSYIETISITESTTLSYLIDFSQFDEVAMRLPRLEKIIFRREPIEEAHRYPDERRNDPLLPRLQDSKAAEFQYRDVGSYMWRDVSQAPPLVSRSSSPVHEHSHDMDSALASHGELLFAEGVFSDGASDNVLSEGHFTTRTMLELVSQRAPVEA